VTLGRRG